MAVPTLQRLASAAICQYVRHFPIQRGKWRLLEWSLPFLVVPAGNGLVVRVSDKGDAGGMNLVWSGTREPETMRLFEEVLRPGMTVVDAGANIGEYALVAASRIGPAGRVHAFEPTPAVVGYLRFNVALNDLENVVINPVALSNVPGDVSLFCDPMEPDANSIVSLGHAKGVATVAAVRLDDYVQRFAIRTVDVLKMDIEGAEIMALHGAERLLSAEDAPILFVEANEGTLARSGCTTRDLIDLIKRHGYACGVIDHHGQTARYSNVLAAKLAHVRRFPVLEGVIAREPL